MTSRWWHGTLAALVLVAIVVQLVVAVRVSGVPHNTSTGVLRGASTPGRIIRILSFFTVQSNLLSGAVSARLAARPHADGRLFRPVRLAALVGITVTGIIYSAVLADIHQPHGAVETFLNTVMHYVVPAAMVVGWLLFGPRRRINPAAIGGALVFPLVWLGYTLARGAIWGWYPYPFLDVPEYGYPAVLRNAVAVTVVFAVVVLVYAAGDRWLPRR